MSLLKKLRRKGFTLIELLISISIIAILVSVGTYSWQNAQTKARDSTRKNDLAQVKAALELYFQENSQYPDPGAGDGCYGGVSCTSDDSWLMDLVPKYINKLPKDPKQVNLPSALANLLKVITSPITNPSPIYAAQYLVTWGSQLPPATMVTNSSNTANITITNSGTLTWNNSAPNPIRFAYHWLDGFCPGGEYQVWDGQRTNLPGNVAPGGVISNLAVTIRAPSTAGNWCLEYDMVQEGITWFNWQGSPTKKIDITVTAPAPPPTPTNLQPNGTITAGIQNITWTASAEATFYYLRVNDLNDASGAEWEPAVCDNGTTPNNGDICQNPAGTSYSYNFVANHSYSIWVHAANAQGYSDPIGVSVTVPPAPTPAPTPTPELTAWWKFDESSGTTAADSSGNGYNATLGTNNTFVPGKIGNALNNPGTSAGATYNYAAGSKLDFTASSTPSISFWMKLGTNITSRLIEARSAGGWLVETGSTGNIVFGTFGGATVTWVGPISPDNAWHMYTITYDGTSAKLYKDGAIVSSQAYTAGWTSGSKTVYLGGDASYPLNGSLDDIRIYNYTLNPAEITSLYNITPTPTPAPTPSPTPIPTPTPPPPNTYLYLYQAAPETPPFSSFILWSTLENKNDQEIYNKPNAKCKDTPPDNTSYNYCLKND